MAPEARYSDDDEDTDTDTDVEGLEYSQTQSSSQLGEWFEIKEIIAEKPTRYRVLWKGIDPTTGEPWKPEWVRFPSVSLSPRMADDGLLGKKELCYGRGTGRVGSQEEKPS
jgi:hypothetical protein